VYSAQHRVHRVQNFIVRKSQDSKAPLVQVYLTEFVLLSLPNVYRPVDFDNELGSSTIEIHDKWIDRMLASEPIAVETGTPKIFPKGFFSVCGMPAVHASNKLQPMPEFL
jgi:hypothetical protein